MHMVNNVPLHVFQSPDVNDSKDRLYVCLVIDFLESKRGGNLDLRIRGARPRGTPSDPVNRIPLGRPKETLKDVELPPKEKLNNFEIRIPARPSILRILWEQT
jgi:hypothetical protein